MLNNVKNQFPNSGPDWHYDGIDRNNAFFYRRGFTFRRSPKRFLLLATLFVLGMAQLITKVEFGWSF